MDKEPWDLEEEYCRSANIHPVCLRCESACKDEYNFWSWSMPGEEYCAGFKQHPFWDLVSEKLEGNI